MSRCEACNKQYIQAFGHLCEKKLAAEWKAMRQEQEWHEYAQTPEGKFDLWLIQNDRL